MKLDISPDLSLPLDAVTRRLAFVGTVGSGKTYGASKLAELMLAAKAQVVVLDPVGVWFGLRLHADGKSAGISIPVFGGMHGDIPLEATAGALIADLIVDRGISIILDVSQFEYDTDKAKFATDFAGRFFFRKKAKPSAVHIFIEECQEFVPQNPQKGEERMLHAFNRMWKIGRNFGIGGSLISQRPQEVSKKALNLSQCLFAFQTMGTHERKAIESWIEDKDLDLDIAADLPKLKVGEPHVWAPAWLGISEKVKISRKWTFNASETPEVGKGAATTELVPIDLEKLSEQMKATIERAKQNDPELLKKRIRELERVKPQPKQVDETAISRAMERGKQQAERDFLARIRTIESTVGKLQGTMKRAAELLVGSAVDIPKFVQAPQTQTAPVRRHDAVFQKVSVGRSQQRLQSKVTQIDTESNLTNPEQRILNAIRWMESIGIDQPEQPAVAFLAGYKYGGGAFNNPRGALRTRGLVEYIGDCIRLTDEGRGLAQEPEAALNDEDLHEHVMRRLENPERRLLKPLLEAYPNVMSNEDLAHAAGYAPNAGAFNNPRGRLRTLGLIEYVSGGVKARSILFPNTAP